MSERLLLVNLAVVGSRGFSNYNLLKRELDNLRISKIISGGARGADSLAEVYARKNEIEVKIFPADWNKHGRRAGYLRNKEIVEECDYLIAFWDGNSRGTAHSIELARAQGKLLKVVRYAG